MHYPIEDWKKAAEAKLNELDGLLAKCANPKRQKQLRNLIVRIEKQWDELNASGAVVVNEAHFPNREIGA